MKRVPPEYRSRLVHDAITRLKTDWLMHYGSGNAARMLRVLESELRASRLKTKGRLL